jgi:hypothetical protein
MSEVLRPTAFAEVNAVLTEFRVSISALLANHLTGIYAVGSLALGDFDPLNSDIDLVVVTDTTITDALFLELQKLHATFAASNSPWAKKVEAVYVPQTTLRRDSPNSEKYPQIERDTTLFKATLEDGWIFQCYTLREHGLVLCGPDPHTLIDPVGPEDMRLPVAVMSGLWLEQARHDPEWLDWARQRDNHRFVILTLCRMLYSLANGAVASKPVAARWAQTELGQPWETLIAGSLARQYEAGDILQRELDETVAFIQYTFEQSQQE